MQRADDRLARLALEAYSQEVAVSPANVRGQVPDESAARLPRLQQRPPAQAVIHGYRKADRARALERHHRGVAVVLSGLELADERDDDVWRADLEDSEPLAGFRQRQPVLRGADVVPVVGAILEVGGLVRQVGLVNESAVAVRVDRPAGVLALGAARLTLEELLEERLGMVVLPVQPA